MTINESARRSAGKLIAAPQNRRGRTVELAHRPPSSRLTHLGRRWFRPAFRPGAASVAERPSQRRQGSLHQMPHLPRPPPPPAEEPLSEKRKIPPPRPPVPPSPQRVAGACHKFATPNALGVQGQIRRGPGQTPLTTETHVRPLLFE